MVVFLNFDDIYIKNKPFYGIATHILLIIELTESSKCGPKGVMKSYLLYLNFAKTNYIMYI